MSDYTGSSTLFYPRPQQPSFDSEHTFQSPTAQWAPVNSSYFASSSRPALSAKPSRKRSRDDADLHEEYAAPSHQDVASMEVVQEPVYGEGMTLIEPDSGRAVGADSQTGTWYEENLEAERKAAEEAAASLERDRLEAQGRPSKSIRFESPTLNASESMTAASQPLASTAAPAIDAASMTLGIGWKTIDGDADMQCAARGWAKYIENHYPLLAGVEVVCKSEGLEAFLVKVMQPQESYWLFKEDLNEGKLVAFSFEKCVSNLRAQPMVFEGTDSICAAASPAPFSAPSPGSVKINMA
jgi:hypothetical protein